MNEPQTPSGNSTDLLLRVLSGVQAGAEARLTDGDYLIGSVEECDIVLQDLPTESVPLRLSIQNGQARVKVDAMTVRLGERTLEPGAEAALLLDTAISYGSVSFALGTAGTDWAAIPLPAPPRHTEEAALIDTATPTDSAPPERKTPASPGSAPTTTVTEGGSRVGLITLTTLGLILLGLILLGLQFMSWIWPGATQTATTAASAARIERVKTTATELDLHDIRVTAQPNGTILVTGYCDTQAIKARFNHALRKIGVSVENQLWPEDILQRDVAQTLKQLAGDRLSFRYPEPGTVELQGYLPSTAVLDRLKVALRNDVPGVARILSRVATLPDFIDSLRKQIDAAGLGRQLKVTAHDDAIVVAGVLDASANSRWRQLAQAFRDQHPQEPMLETHIESPSEAAPSEMPKLVLRGILIGEDGRAYAALSQGRQICEGDRLKDGSIVEAIRFDRMILRKGTQSQTYYVGDTADD